MIECDYDRAKADPDWKDICAKCNDGDIEPHYCEYYGEPNGCNSPIYGEHPTAEKSSVVGNVAKLREALKKCLLYIACAESVGIGAITLNDKVKLDPKKIIKSAKEALAAPQRNCDVYDAKTAEKEFVRQTGSKSIRSKSVRWLYAPATEQEGETK